MRNDKLMLIAGACIGMALLGSLVRAKTANQIYLEASPCDRCVQPGEVIEVAVKVRDLQQRIDMVDATLTHTGVPCETGKPDASVCVEAVLPGEPFWTDVLLSTDNTATHFIMGLQPPAFKALGTIADNTVALIRLKACTEGKVTLAIEGTAYGVPCCLYPCPRPQPSVPPLTPGDDMEIRIDTTAPIVKIDAITHEDCPGVNLLLEGCPCPCATDCPPATCCAPGSCDTTLCAGPGKVTIAVTATDNCDNERLRPSVQVITACGTPTDITHTQQEIPGGWAFTYDVRDTTEPGPATVRAQVTDCAGNVSLQVLAVFQICPKPTISGLVEPQGFSGSFREVYFTLRDEQGEPLATLIQVLQCKRMQGIFDNAVGAYVLEVPAGIERAAIREVQAKTAWNLSRTITIGPDNRCCGHLVVNFTRADMLRAGDVATDNEECGRYRLGDDSVDVTDLWVVENAVGDASNYYNYWADVNGDGIVNETDKDWVLLSFGAFADPVFTYFP
jgi:hypothetical protein